MAASTLVITKTWKDGTDLTEAQLDNIKNDTESWAADTVNNINQFRLDVFGSSYSFDNDGSANNPTAMNVGQTITPTATINGIDLVCTALTTGSAVDASDADALTSGILFNLASNSSNTSTRTLLQLINDNTAATGCTPLSIQQDAATRAMFIDQNADANAFVIDSESTTAAVMDFGTVQITTGSVFVPGGADSLTTGNIINATSDSSDSSDRNLIRIVNDNALATGATGLFIQQDAANRAFFIDQNGAAEAMALDVAGADVGFINFIAGADADATSAISTLTTQGAVQGHVQIEVNGVSRWLSFRADPS